jgi:hypothetical protein
LFINSVERVAACVRPHKRFEIYGVMPDSGSTGDGRPGVCSLVHDSLTLEF